MLFANSVKVKYRAEDVKTDRVDSKLLADLTRMNWLPTYYVPLSELRFLRNLLGIDLVWSSLIVEEEDCKHHFSSSFSSKFIEEGKEFLYVNYCHISN